jgi:muconate cycloisomerase
VKIIDVELTPFNVRRRYATQIAQEGGGAREVVEASPFLFLRATTDTGHIGWGEISDIEPDEVPEVEAWREKVAAALVDRNPVDIARHHADWAETFPDPPGIGGSSLNRLTRAGLDMVCYDLVSHATSTPVCRLLGGEWRDRIHISWVAFIRDDLQLLREEIAEKCAEGFTAFKLKVGVDIDLDEQRLAVMRDTAGPEASIKIDPNGGWDQDQAVTNIGRLARFDLDGVETPVGGRDPAEIAAVRREVDVRLIEHVSTPVDALEYIRHESLDVFNIATTGCGGIFQARRIAQMAETAGVGLLLGSTVEMGPGTRAQVQLAASIRGLTLASDLVGPGLYAEDVLTEPPTYVDGCLEVPRTIGFGAGITL